MQQFRDFVRGGDTKVRSLSISTWFREPDFADEYERLYRLEEELGDGKPCRHELLSVWRLARDAHYAEWAKTVGPDTCQISFFGMEETTDWFYQRRGAFKDALTATERLLDAGMKPRWQIFLTKKLLPEIHDLLRLIDRLRLRQRVQALGSEFRLFMHLPSPDHEARKIEFLRPTFEDAAQLPEEILEPSRKHLGRLILWQPESELHAAILRDGDRPPGGAEVHPEVLWFFVANNWDVYSNVGTMEPWWKLGNLKEDSVATITRRFEQNDALGLKVLLECPARELAQEHGNPQGNKIYTDRGDLLSLYRAAHCEARWR